MLTPGAAPAFLAELVLGLYARARQPDPPPRFGNMLVVDQPHAIDRVARAHDLFAKNYFFISAVGRSRFNTNGDEWAARRDLTQPQYLAAAKPQGRPAVYRAYFDRLVVADPADSQSVQRALFSASLDVFHRALGCEAPIGDVVAAIERARDLVRRLQFQSWSGSVYAREQDVEDDKDELLAVFQALLEASPTAAALVRHLTKHAGRIPGFAPIEEYVMNLFAGVETTVATILWAIDRLGGDNEAQARIRQEVESEASDQPYLDCFINETMRYFPAIPFLVRQATADTNIDDTPIAAGDLIVVSVVGAHHNAKVWRDPQIFDFSRREFLDGSYDRRAFIPFFVGPRMCGGARLAQMEVWEAVRAFVRLFTVARQGSNIAFNYALALRPETWRFLTVTRR